MSFGASHIASWMRRRAANRRFNPYVVGTPVFDRHLFFGREALARRAVELLPTCSLRLSGERRIGKTSFLHQLRRSLAASGGTCGWYPVFVDLETVSARDVLHSLMDETLEVLALWPRVPAGLRFRRGREEYLPVDFCHDLERVLDALGGRERRRVRLVYLIDEIDALEAGSLQLAHARLAPLLSPRTDELRVVLAGVGPSARESTGTNAHDGSLATLELEPLAPCDAEALVREPVAGVYAYADTAVDCILEASRLRPFVIQRLCRRAVDRMLDDGRSTVLESDVVAGPVDAGALV